MRRLFASLLLLVPLFAAGQTVDASNADTASGNWLSASTATVWPGAQPASGFSLVEDASGPRLQYRFGPSLRADLGVSGRAWSGASGPCASLDRAAGSNCFTGLFSSSQMVGSEVGARLLGSGYSVGMGVSSTKHVVSHSPLLPRVLPDSTFTHAGLPLSELDHSDSLNARGRIALGRTGIDMGASVGRIRLLPGNLLGIDTLGQKSLSLGVDRGPLSGSVIGRVVQPQSGQANALGADHRWTTIDLGVTWRLPWRGELSFGAQNVWSSGQLPKPKAGPEPDQTRMPYVQYHQDL